MSDVTALGGILNLKLDRQELGVTGRQFQQLKRTTFAAMGREWHAHYRHLHFLEGAFARYGYTRRKGMRQAPGSKGFRSTYTGRKLRKYGHFRPLVFSGDSEQLSRLLDLRVSANQARVVLPRGFNRKNPKSQIDMRAELTRVLQPEADEIAQVGATALGRELDDLLSKQT